MNFYGTGSRNVDAFNRVLSVSNIRAVNGDALEYREKDVRIESGFSGETDSHQATIRPQIVNRLGVATRLDRGK